MRELASPALAYSQQVANEDRRIARDKRVMTPEVAAKHTAGEIKKLDEAIEAIDEERMKYRDYRKQVGGS